jgi:RNA polymerase sigma factor (TIGR02999 family)
MISTVEAAPASSLSPASPPAPPAGAPEDPRAADRLVPALYDELRRLARSHLRRERPEHTLGATALVHEAYMRMAGAEALNAESRTRFFAVASATMRRVLVDHARRRRRQKRGGGEAAVPLEDVEALLTDEEADELVSLDTALDRLAVINARGAVVVEHRFFSGLTLEETAELLGVSTKTVQRDWLAARAWLRKEVAADLGLLDLPA